MRTLDELLQSVLLCISFFNLRVELAAIGNGIRVWYLLFPTPKNNITENVKTALLQVVDEVYQSVTPSWVTDKQKHLSRGEL